MERARLISVQVGQPRAMEFAGEAWTSAIYKASVEARLFLGRKNLTGDRQANRKVHGGPDKAVCCFPAEHYPFWREELGRGDAFGYGAFGENFTVEGMTEERVCIGDVYGVGAARVQISQPRMPCINLARKWSCASLPQRMIEVGYTGYYLRVLQEGEVGVGDALTLLERPHPAITVALVNDAYYRRERRPETLLRLVELPELAPSARWILRHRMGA